jgi:hypothetical protein
VKRIREHRRADAGKRDGVSEVSPNVAATIRREYRSHLAATQGHCPDRFDMEKVRATIEALRERIMRRNAIRAYLQEYLDSGQARLGLGYYVNYTNDPTWLVDMAINRRAGWPDDPDHRGSCMPVNGKFPKRAVGNGGTALTSLANRLRGTRIRVEERELRIFPEHTRKRLLKLYPHRFT